MRQDIAERFRRDTAEHAMVVLHDQGLYRHIRFHRPSPHSWAYWFDLITVPGALIFRGDGESFVFSRLDDMFAFFRRSIYGDHPNYGYWAEKLTTVDGERGVKRYDQEILRRHVLEIVAEYAEQFPGLLERVTERVLDELSGDRSFDRDLVEEFRYWVNPDDEFAIGHKPPDFEFTDAWEWDLTDYHWWFLWACHAIAWGISQYDALKSAAVAS